jgi:hypothetical protein
MKLSSDPKKAKAGMTDQKCLVCQCTLFITDVNPCHLCANSFSKEIDIDLILNSMGK